MTQEDVVSELRVIIATMQQFNWHTAYNKVIDLYAKLNETPADIKKEKGGHWW